MGDPNSAVNVIKALDEPLDYTRRKGNLTPDSRQKKDTND